MSNQPTLQEVCEKYWPEGCPAFRLAGGVKVFWWEDVRVTLIGSDYGDAEAYLPIIAATAWAWWKMKQVAAAGDQNADWDYACEATLAWASLIKWEPAQ